MSVLSRSIQATQSLADTATSAAGAVAGAAAGGLVGAVGGGVRGAEEGLAPGSRSVPAAALTLAAIGAAGLIDWPVLVALGGGALILSRLRRGPQETSGSTNAHTATADAARPPTNAATTSTTSRKPRKTGPKTHTSTPKSAATSR